MDVPEIYAFLASSFQVLRLTYDKMYKDMDAGIYEILRMTVC